jgi:hypothetical protein
MKVVWKAVHQNDRRLLARILSGVNAVVIPLYKPLCEIHVSRWAADCADTQMGFRVIREICGSIYFDDFDRIRTQNAPNYARCAPGLPFTVIKRARVDIGDSGTVTFCTTRKSAVNDSRVTSQRT